MGLSSYFTQMGSNMKEVKSYQGNHGFQIWMQWVVVNSLPFMSNEDPFLMLPSQSIKLSLYFFFFSPLAEICL
jgi:hypothetical protein